MLAKLQQQQQQQQLDGKSAESGLTAAEGVAGAPSEKGLFSLTTSLEAKRMKKVRKSTLFVFNVLSISCLQYTVVQLFLTFLMAFFCISFLPSYLFHPFLHFSPPYISSFSNHFLSYLFSVCLIVPFSPMHV